MSLYPLNPTPNTVRNLEAYVAHAEAAATAAQTAAQGITDQVAIATTQAGNALKSAQDAAAAASNTGVLHGDIAQTFTDSQIAQFITNLQLAPISFGDCRFVFVGPTQCVLNPIKGGLLTVNRLTRAIPSAGVTFTTTLNAGGIALSPATLYYAYVFWTGLTWGWEFSTTGLTVDGYGMPIKAGDPTRTCVGMVYTDGTGKFEDDSGFRGVASYFNRQWKSLFFAQTSGSTSSGTPTPAGGVNCLSWGTDAIHVHITGSTYNAKQFGQNYTYLAVNGVQRSGQQAAMSALDSVVNPLSVTMDYISSIGFAAISSQISTSNGQQGAWQFNVEGASLQ